MTESGAERRHNIPKALLLTAGGLILAAVGTAQGASNVLSTLSPAEAIGLSPFAADAAERLTRTTFIAGGTAGGAIPPGNVNPASQPSAGGLDGQPAIDPAVTRKFALTALYRNPLAADAAAIYAAGLPADRRGNALVAAGALTKRSRLLNGLLLREYQQAGNAEAVLVTLDQTLRVRPRLQSEIVPVLVALLNTREAVPYFTKVLQDGPTWTNAFLSAAARNPQVTGNLAALRIALTGKMTGETTIELDTDRAIIEALIRDNALENAAEVYRVASEAHNRPGRSEADSTSAAPSNSDRYRIDWKNALPPLEWKFAEERGLYARTRRSSADLQISIQPGFGGTLAQRFILLPDDARALVLRHSIGPEDLREQVTVSLACASDNGGGDIQTMPLGASPMRLAWRDGNPCPIAQITIAGRAFTTDRRISGFIEPIEIRR